MRYLRAFKPNGEMSMKACTRLVGILALFAMFPAAAFAQSGVEFHSVGVHFGGQLDTTDGSAVMGLDTRVVLGYKDLEFNPRFTFRPINDGSSSQVDLNILQNYVLANPGLFLPFVGAGAAIHHTSYDAADGNTKVGLNLLSGTRIVMSNGARYEPFVQGQYTILSDAPNPFTIVVGVSFNLK